MTSTTGSKIGVILPCVSEAQNIIRILKLFECFHQTVFPIEEAMVICGPSTDETAQIAENFSRSTSLPLRVLNQEGSGKTAAVHQALLQLANVDFVLLCSADVLPELSGLKKMFTTCRDNDEIGVVGGRPIVDGGEQSIGVRLSRFHWDVHHFIASRSPKTTEVTLFRRIDLEIDTSVTVDEAEIERVFINKGFRITYLPEARIYTSAPLTISDYFHQRLRVTLGHLSLQQHKHFKIGSLRWKLRVRSLLSVLKSRPPSPVVLVLGMALEVLVWIVASVLLAVGHRPKPNWQRIVSAKRKLKVRAASLLGT